MIRIVITATVALSIYATAFCGFAFAQNDPGKSTFQQDPGTRVIYKFKQDGSNDKQIFVDTRPTLRDARNLADEYNSNANDRNQYTYGEMSQRDWIIFVEHGTPGGVNQSPTEVETGKVQAREKYDSLKPRKASMDERKKKLDAEREWLIKENREIRSEQNAIDLLRRRKASAPNVGGPYTLYRRDPRQTEFMELPSYNTLGVAQQELRQNRENVAPNSAFKILDRAGNDVTNSTGEAAGGGTVETALQEREQALESKRATRNERLKAYNVDKAQYEADLQQFEGFNGTYKRQLNSLRPSGSTPRTRPPR